MKNNCSDKIGTACVVNFTLMVFAITGSGSTLKMAAASCKFGEQTAFTFEQSFKYKRNYFAFTGCSSKNMTLSHLISREIKNFSPELISSCLGHDE